ncbi:MAG: uridine kinase [Candidatus Eisenbacteria bacterium]|nr:uridine kinase [Candidatus Eisenbacteria bacterium]
MAQRRAENASPRSEAIDQIAGAVLDVRRGHPVRVAIDGVGASGKTRLADELAEALERSGREIIRASVDGFHNPPAVRYRRGGDSPEGYYRDSFDREAIRACIVDPLGEGGGRVYRPAVYDFRSESEVRPPSHEASEDAVLLFDGVFLLRPEMRSWWDYSVFVEAGFDVTLQRALTRDLELFGTEEAVRERYEKRYIPGERMYLERDRPREHADVVFMNDDPARPVVRWNRRAGRGGTT